MKVYNSFSEIKSDLESGTTSCVALVNSYIEAAEAKKNLNIFLELFKSSALEKATLVDEKIKSKTAGRLAGMVIALKDNLCYKGHKVSASSKILEGFESL